MPSALARLLLCGLAAAAPALAATLDLARANQAELEMLKGVGPQWSERILAERARAPFRDWPDFIRRVPGIGPQQARRLSDAGLRIGGQAYLPTPASAAGH